MKRLQGTWWYPAIVMVMGKNSEPGKVNYN